MECFIFKEMNKAIRNKDEKKIKYYGAFASALGFIIHGGNSKEAGLSKHLMLYRGLKIPREEITRVYQKGKVVSLTGFTSSSKNRDTGLSFALGDPSEEDSDKEPVLFEIKIIGGKQCLFLNSKELSAYPDE